MAAKRGAPSSPEPQLQEAKEQLGVSDHEFFSATNIAITAYIVETRPFEDGLQEDEFARIRNTVLENFPLEDLRELSKEPSRGRWLRQQQSIIDQLREGLTVCRDSSAITMASSRPKKQGKALTKQQWCDESLEALGLLSVVGEPTERDLLNNIELPDECKQLILFCNTCIDAIADILILREIHRDGGLRHCWWGNVPTTGLKYVRDCLERDGDCIRTTKAVGAIACPRGCSPSRILQYLLETDAITLKEIQTLCEDVDAHTSRR